MKILLTFDLEEFNLPLEYNISLKKSEQFTIPKQGLDNLLKLLEKYNIKATFFTTAEFAKKYPLMLLELSKNHEIACHGLFHSSCSLDEIKLAKTQIEKITDKKITGFRAPKFQFSQIQELKNLGFEYDSSIHPIWLPGRYFNIYKKRNLHKIGGIIEIPPSTLPVFRFPIFWLAFKNFPLLYSKIFTKINSMFSDYTMLVFHPWEFENLDNIKIPKYIKKPVLKKLEKYIKFCIKNNYAFLTISYYLQKSLKCPNTALMPLKLNFKSS